MGLFIKLTELLGRLTVLTPLLERYMGSSRGAATEHIQRSVADLSLAQSELTSTVASSLKDQQIHLARLEELAARVANRLAELMNDREKLEADFRRLNGLLRMVLALCLALLVAVLAAIGLMVFKLR